MSNNKPRGRQQSERGLVDMSTPVADEGWRPDLDECEHEEYRIYLLGTDDAVNVSLWTDEYGQVVHFALVQIARVGDDEHEDWAEVAKVDCAHGTVHIHRYAFNGDETSNKVYCEINGPADVTAGYEYGQTVIVDKWEQNRRRWEYGN